MLALNGESEREQGLRDELEPISLNEDVDVGHATNQSAPGSMAHYVSVDLGADEEGNMQAVGSPRERMEIDGADKIGTVSHICLVSKSIKIQLVAMMLYSLLSTAKNIVFFPYLRTTIACNSNLAPVNPQSELWSGSQYCTDLKHVAREAQFLKGLAEGLDQAVHCLALPALGHAIDCFGRRFGVLLGLIGVLLQSLCFFIAAYNGYGTISSNFILIGSVIQGLTGVFMTAVQASVRDLQHAGVASASRDHDSHAYGAMQMSQGVAQSIGLVVVVATVISHNLDDYVSFWAWVVSFTLGTVFLLFFIYEETLHESQQWQWRKASPTRIITIFLENETVRWVGFAVFFFVLSMSSLTTLQAFTVSEYNWTQTYSTVVFVALTPIAVTSLLASFSLIPRFGPLVVLGGGVWFTLLGMASLCFAGSGPAFVFVGISFLFAAGGALPALMQFLTSLAGRKETGELLANVGAVALAAVAIGNMFYGFLFRHLHDYPSLSFQIGGFPAAVFTMYCGMRVKRSANASS